MHKIKIKNIVQNTVKNKYIILLMILLLGVTSLSYIFRIFDKNIMVNGNKVISREAMDDLVTKAAEQKYLHDVLTKDVKPLPTPKSILSLMPAHSEPEVKNAEITVAVPNIKEQRCVYNSQSYVVGDIVKTEQGWVRCTPTLIFASDKPNIPQYGSAAWTAVQ